MEEERRHEVEEPQEFCTEEETEEIPTGLPVIDESLPEAVYEHSRESYLADRDRDRSENAKSITREKTGLYYTAALNEAVKNKRILEATIVGVDRIPARDREYTICVAAVPDQGLFIKNPIKILIPFQEMFAENPMDMSTVDMKSERGRFSWYRRQEQFLVKMTGLKIELVLTEYRLEEPMILCVGSRAMALRRLRARYFGEERLLKDDTDIEVRILSVSANAIAVTAGGVDTVLQKFLVTHRYITDLRQAGPELDLKTGRTITVRLLSAERRENGLIRMNLDRRPVEMEEFKRRNCLVRSGTVTRGIITELFRVEDSDNIRVRLYLPTYDLVAKAMTVPASSFGVTVKSGTEVVFAVLNAEETGYLFGYIKSVIG